MRDTIRPLAILVLVSLLGVVGACGTDVSATADTSTAADVSTSADTSTAADEVTVDVVDSGDDSDTGIRLVSADEAAATLASPPDDLVVLDVRTLEEFEEARLADATMIDFYQADFADRLAGLDRDQPYLLYCRSGNRSGQTRAIMEDLGFTNVADVDGGINAWLGNGHPVTSG